MSSKSKPPVCEGTFGNDYGSLPTSLESAAGQGVTIEFPLATLANDSHQLAPKVVNFQSSQDHGAGVLARSQCPPWQSEVNHALLPDKRKSKITVAELKPPLAARNGHTLKVILPCRVSDPGPGKQDIMSLADQEAMHRRWLSEHTSLPLSITVLAGSGSGECLERREYRQLIELVESNEFDLVLTEDLGRILRRIQAHLLCELCVDHRVRLIACNDHIDTLESGWEDRSIISASHHERSNRDTSDRIKRTHRNRFEQGRCLSLPIYGYRKAPGGKTDDDLKKVPEAEAIYKEWFERLDNGNSYSEIADWLNSINVPTGQYTRQAKWDCHIVTRTTHNLILKGWRFRDKRKTKRNNETGRYISEKAEAKDLLLRHVPHLAFFDEAYYDRVIAKVDARNAKFRRNGNGGPDPCRDRPKKRTRFPGQTVYCGICGRLYVFGGHGQTDHLMCEGARAYKCWNCITFDGTFAAEKIAEAALSELRQLEDFDPVFLNKFNEEYRLLDASRNARLQEIDREQNAVQRKIENLMKFICGGDCSERVRAELRQLEDYEKSLLRQKDEIERMPSHAIVIPSAAEIMEVTENAFQDLGLDSFEFAKRMRQMTGKIYVYPFRLCEGAPFVLRAKLKLHLAALLPDKRLREALEKPLRRVLKLDLFTMPQRVALREQVVDGRQELTPSGRVRTEREVAKSLGITKTAAQQAAALDRLMTEQGLTDPYVLLSEPPMDYPKLRRHLHPRYRFEPLPGHVPDW